MKRVCSVCLINCFKMHGARGDGEGANMCLRCAVRKAPKGDAAGMTRHPSFLKRMTESTVGALKLPLSFVADHPERLGDDAVTLEGPGGEQWRVELRRSFRSFSVSFGQGWAQFVADHGLQIGDQLSFALCEKYRFQVEVYDGFGVQKRSALDATNTSADRKATHSGEDLAQDNPEKPTQSADEQLLIDLIQLSDSESRIVSAPPADEQEVAYAAAAAAAAPGTAATVKVEEEEEEEEFLPPQTLFGGKVFSERRPVTELEKVQALRGAHALQLVNPNITMVMSKGHVYSGFWLTVPKRFAKDWMPKENKEITLLNKGGHKWPSKWLAAQGGLSAGWRRFSLDHRLEEFDVCVLELIDKADHSILVHIFRVLGGAHEDPGRYVSAATPLRNFEGRRTTRRIITSESELKSSFKRKLNYDEASGSLIKRLDKTPDERGNWESCDVKPRHAATSSTDLVNLALSLLKDLEATQHHRRDSAACADEVHEELSYFGDVLLPDADAVDAGDRHMTSTTPHEGRLESKKFMCRVVNICKGRSSVGNNTDFLAEIQGCDTEGSCSGDEDNKGFLWIPSDQFEWDMEHCRVNHRQLISAPAGPSC